MFSFNVPFPLFKKKTKPVIIQSKLNVKEKGGEKGEDAEEEEEEKESK